MTMAEQNVANVKRGYAAFNSADMKTLTEIFHENATWHTPGRSPVAGDRKDRNSTFAQFGRYGAETHGTFKAVLKSVAVTEDGRVVGIHQNTGTRNGKTLSVDCCIVFDFKDGQCISGREYFYDLNAWDAFWS